MSLPIPTRSQTRATTARRIPTAALLAAGMAIAGASPIPAQGTTWQESWTGSEWELYTRALATRGLVAQPMWAIRPVGPGGVRRMAASISPDHPWKSRLPRTDSLQRRVILRPAASASYNSGFAWGTHDGAVWQGRGLNGWGSAGAMLGWRMLTLRVEPGVAWAANRSFELRQAAGPSEFSSPIGGIDLPQRFGDAPVARVTPGESYIRADVGPLAVGLSTASVAWGPAVRHGLVLAGGSGGFPHLFAGTGRPLRTPAGSFAGQVLYASLAQSPWAAPLEEERRFASGLVATWEPFDLPLVLGVARFYHRAWPRRFGSTEFLAPFGSAFHDAQVAGEGPDDNQLASAFASVRLHPLGLEVFGEFGRNDRSQDLRDLALEPEHNAAWVLGLLHATQPDSVAGHFWTTRLEIANARISRIQDIGRGQALFYTHTRIVQGHTHQGRLLGTPLAEESGGLELAVDRWAQWGRAGVTLMERQLPGDALVGMPADAPRSQWELGASGTLFRGTADLHAQVGYVWDLGRFPDRDAGNLHLRIGLRSGLSGLLAR